MSNDEERRPEPRRLYQVVADQLRALIAGGGLPASGRLPSERDLAQQLGVSRPSLREALIALEIDGTVEVRMGSGVYVCARPERLAEPTGSLGDSPSELMQARVAIEGTVVLLAAARMTADALLAIAEALARMREAVAAARAPLAEDRAFHVAIAHAGGNAVLTRIVAELFDERFAPLAAQLRQRAENVATWKAALAEHEAILSALEARDLLAAEAAMRIHLTVSTQRWIGEG